MTKSPTPSRPLDLTVAIPTLNCAQTLPFTLESVRPLKAAGARIVVADSDSTDGTRELATEFADLVLTVPKGNMYAAINAALKDAPSEWLTYINGDDLLYADTVVDALSRVPTRCDLIYGHIDYIDHSGKFLHSWRSPSEASFLPLFASGVNPIAQQGTFFRRRVFQALDGFETKFKNSADFDFFLRAKLRECPFFLAPGPRIAAYRIHGQQFSHRAGLDELLRQAKESVVKNGLRVPRWRQQLAFWRFRVSNWDSYLVRFLRRRQLTGSFRWSATMDPA